ncbi:unnamed protein product, partial [Mesorhabditis spiculigera]
MASTSGEESSHIEMSVKAANVLADYGFEPLADVPGVYFGHQMPKVHDFWLLLLATKRGILKSTRRPYFDNRKAGIYLSLVDPVILRTRTALSEDAVSPWTSGQERMHLDNYYADGENLSSRTTGNAEGLRVTHQRYSKHPGKLPISKKILSIPHMRKPALVEPNTYAVVCYKVSEPFEMPLERTKPRVKPEAVAAIRRLTTKHPGLNAGKIHELLSIELHGVDVPDVAQVGYQQKKLAGKLQRYKLMRPFLQNQPGTGDEDDELDMDSMFDDYYDEESNQTLDTPPEDGGGPSFSQFDGSISVNEHLQQQVFGQEETTNGYHEHPEPPPPPYHAPKQHQFSNSVYQQEIPGYYMDLAQGMSVMEAVSLHGSIPDTGSVFHGAQKIVLDGIVKTMNELLNRTKNNFHPPAQMRSNGIKQELIDVDVT